MGILYASHKVFMYTYTYICIYVGVSSAVNLRDSGVNHQSFPHNFLCIYAYVPTILFLMAGGPKFQLDLYFIVIQRQACNANPPKKKRAFLRHEPP